MPPDHPLRAIRRITDRALERLSPRFGRLYINFRPTVDSARAAVAGAGAPLRPPAAFYSREQLAELLPIDALRYFGLPDDFAARKVRQRYQCCHALLAGVFYDDPDRLKAEPDSVLLILKPTVSGEEPLDVLEYKRAHAAFPHESTIDQYFDEAQWESYRRLGEHIASVVFESSGAGVWAPRKFVKPPAPTSPWPRTRAGATVST